MPLSKADLQEIKNLLTPIEEKLDNIIPVKKMVDCAIVSDVNRGMWNRKWNITVKGLPGRAREPNEVTIQNVVKFAEKHNLPFSNRFAACHRLDQRADSKIIIRFSVSDR